MSKTVKFIRRHYQFFGVVVILVLFLYLLTLISPEEIVAAIGIENIYIFAFIFSIVGGVSFISAAGFYAAIVTLALGGANPYFLAIASAPGILIGDLVFWYVGKKSRTLVEDTFGSRIASLSRWLRSKPEWLVMTFVFVYTGLTPLPGDILMIAMAVSGYHFREIFWPTLLGNLTLVLLLALSAIHGFDFFVNLF